MPRPRSSETLFDSDIPLPRTIAFGFRTEIPLPKTVGRYNYRSDLPELGIDNLFDGHRKVVLLIKEFLRSVCYPFVNEPQGKDATNFPLLDEFIAQMIVISNVPYCVIAGTLNLLQRYLNTYAKWHSGVQWCPWMNAYDLFLSAFIVSAASAVDTKHDYDNPRYWENITGIHFEMLLWMMENFCLVINFKCVEELRPLFETYNEDAMARGYFVTLGYLKELPLDFGCLSKTPEEEVTCASWGDFELEGVDKRVVPEKDSQPEPESVPSWISKTYLFFRTTIYRSRT